MDFHNNMMHFTSLFLGIGCGGGGGGDDDDGCYLSCRDGDCDDGDNGGGWVDDGCRFILPELKEIRDFFFCSSL